MRSIRLVSLSLSALVLAITVTLPLRAVAHDVSLEAAAVKAERWAFYAPNGYRWEYGGILVLHNGKIIHSFPRTLEKVDAAPMEVNSKQLHPGDKLLGLYHTHPCMPKIFFSQYYSPQDLVSVFFYKVPSFILDECTGDVHEFDPAIDRVRDSGKVVTIMQANHTRRRVHLPSGRIIGNIGDQGPDLSALLEELMEDTDAGGLVEDNN